MDMNWMEMEDANHFVVDLNIALRTMMDVMTVFAITISTLKAVQRSSVSLKGLRSAHRVKVVIYGTERVENVKSAHVLLSQIRCVVMESVMAIRVWRDVRE